MRKIFMLVVLAVALAPVVAHAQPSRVIPEETPPPKPTKKRPSIALGLSAAGLAAGAGMAAAGIAIADEHNAGNALFGAGLVTMVVGPSAGHLYAGEWKHAVVTSGARAIGAGLAIHGFAVWLGDTERADLEEPREYGEEAMAIGAVLYVGAALYDLIDAPLAAKRSNRRALTIAPTVTEHGAGLAIAGSLW